MPNIVWVNISCLLVDGDTVLELVEEAHDADLYAGHPDGTGPLRTQRYNPTTEELLSERWEYGGQTWQTPEGTEQQAIDAWRPPPPPEEPTP
ncbi:MAG: hypothetical protein ABW217_16125 [Polyangiaceae bacterium]